MCLYCCSILLRLLGFKSSKNMNLVKLVLNIDALDDSKSTPDLEPLLEQYKELFSGIGKIQGKCKIHLKEGVVPTAYHARKVPIAMREKLKQELNRLESLRIIEKVEDPTEWVNSMVLVEKKDGGVRLCIDLVDLNKAIKRPHYPIPTFKDAISDLSGAKYFSKLDATSGYWSLVLSKSASDLTTFNTIYGRYRWRRYPFGLISAQDEFQRKMEEIFQGLKGLKILVDDLLIYGATREEHNRRLTEVLERARQKGVKFNRSKCQIAVQSVCYFGHIISNAGIKPDPEKLRAINEMPTPKSKKELQTFLGMLNFLSRYIPNLETQNQPLRDRIKADEFEWKELHTTCLNQLKESIVTNLAFFDSSSPTLELEVDASKHGLGAQISANGKIFAYASRSLSKSGQELLTARKGTLCHSLWLPALPPLPIRKESTSHHGSSTTQIYTNQTPPYSTTKDSTPDDVHTASARLSVQPGSPVERPAWQPPSPEHNGNTVNVPTSAVTQPQTKPVPDRGGVTQTRSGRTIIKPTRLNL
ncbi:hypothetical protein QYM36_013861 [Artemia franciscana]|uniref:Reverse transcriptase domain-containing protein n=1 Tax=Artemia franciscana TaxID=6661 RepID=A0AA88HMF3_ARTSF|nr:hypothetical protein QYM36_013861 [Artemia franciscana]